MENLTIHAKMALIKKEISETKITKSGHNKFAGFHYHELSDFMEVINKLNCKHGINDVVEINKNEQRCSITLINTKDSKDFYVISIPFQEAEMLGKGGVPSSVDAIQRMGSTITYNRRYLYMTAYNIQENDGVDGTEQVNSKKTQNAVLATKSEIDSAILIIYSAESVEDLTTKYKSLTNGQKGNPDVIKVATEKKIELTKN